MENLRLRTPAVIVHQQNRAGKNTSDTNNFHKV